MQVNSVGPQGLKDLLREPIGARAIFANVIKHIAEAFAGLGPPRPVDGNFLTWSNNKHTLHTCNIMVNR